MKTVFFAIVLCLIQLAEVLGGDKGQTLSSVRQRGVKVTEVENATYRFEYPGGKMLYKDLGDYHYNMLQRSSSAIDSTVIDLRTIDTSLHSNKYKFWQEVDVSEGDFSGLVIGDVNKNKRPEIYGFSKAYETYNPSSAGIYELDSTNVFRLVYQYPDTVHFAQRIYDVDKDGRDEVFMFAGGHAVGQMYKANSTDGLPTVYTLWYNRSVFQYYDPTLGDFDKNGKTDLVYGDGFNVFIDEYNPSTVSFDSVYRFGKLQHYVAGYSVGDFDMDGKTDIAFGSSSGEVYVIEAQGVGTYQNIWKGNVETNNAYLHFTTNDIDSNGKPEFWVGGDAYYNGVGMTRFTCFEKNGDNSYAPVARIDLVGVFSFFAGNCFAKDIDKDDKEELFICIDQHVIILKFAGSPNHHAYDIFYLKRNELANQNSVYYGATLFDLDGGGKDELFITHGQVRDFFGTQQRREFTYIYKPDFAMGIKAPWNSVPSDFRLLQNYPNPFNSSTKIRFEIPRLQGSCKTTLRVYNILGKEIRLLLDAEVLAGQYTAEWNGTDNREREVGSGVYFISLETQKYRKTIKAVLLK